MVLQSTSGCLESVLMSMWTNSGIVCLEIARTMNSTCCCVEEEFHAKMRDLKRENSLNPVLLIMITSFIHEMYEDMPCMHRILHVGKNSENYTFIMSH